MLVYLADLRAAAPSAAEPATRAAVATYYYYYYYYYAKATSPAVACMLSTVGLSARVSVPQPSDQELSSSTQMNPEYKVLFNVTKSANQKKLTAQSTVKYARYFI